MRRTLSLRIYTDAAYSEKLQSGASNHVRLIYATQSGGGVVQGGIVPGAEFECVGDNVWECNVDSALLDGYRNDFYFLQYTTNGGSTWSDVEGYDPFYFATKINNTPDTGTAQPNISGLKPQLETISENSIAIEVAVSSSFSGGVSIPSTWVREYSYSFAETNLTPTPGSIAWEKRTSLDNTLTVNRIGTSVGLGDWFYVKVRLNNPVSGAYTAYSDISVLNMAAQSVSEILGAAEPDEPSAMVEGDVVEVDMYGRRDGIFIRTPVLNNRGDHCEVAIQYGGTPFTISSGELDGFTGVIMPTTNNGITVAKPLVIKESVDAYFARRIVGYGHSTKWVGANEVDAFSETITAPGVDGILSPSIVDALIKRVVERVETSSGNTLAEKP